MDYRELDELINNTVGLVIEMWKVRFDFDKNMMFFIDKLKEDEEFINTSPYKTTFRFYDYGWKGTQAVIDQKGLTKKELLEWFDESFEKFYPYECTYERYFERGNWKEIKLIIHTKWKED